MSEHRIAIAMAYIAAALLANAGTGCGSSSNTTPVGGASDDGGSSSSGAGSSGSSGGSSGISPGGSSGSQSSSGGSSGAPTGSSSGAPSGSSSSSSGGSGGSSGSSSGNADAGLPDASPGGPVDAGWPPPIDGGVPYSGPTTAGTVAVTRGSIVGHLGPGFAGFSFEKTHMTDGSLTGTNAPLIALFRLLGPGLVRIGANDVNKSQWMASATPMSGGMTSLKIGTADVDQLAAFLKAADWKVLYGLDMTLESAPWTNDVAEATYAANALGANLYAFEMGNEDGDVATYNANWKGIQTAIHAAVPNALFSGGETSGPISRATSFASMQGSLAILLTHHHYLAGAGDANATMANLFTGDTDTGPSTKALADSASANHIRDGYRWGEDNSYFRHGQAGVSDAYGSALWGIEHMFTVAENGGAGVHFHGGGDNQDGNNCPSGHASCSKPFVYSPIDEANAQVTGAAPLFYGMLFISRAGVGNVFATTVSAGGLNVTAHAVGLADGSTNVIIVNPDANSGVTASVNVGAAVTSASAVYLRGTSLAATTGVTFAGSGVSATGVWTPNASYKVPTSGNTVTVVVPPMSAALVQAH